MTTVQGGILVTPPSAIAASSGRKVTVVGAGQVGMACAFAVLAQNISTELCIIDAAVEKLTGEMLDIQHGSVFLQSPKILAGDDYSISKGSRVCIVTAGARQKEGETRLALVKRNADILKAIIPKLIEHSPDTILLIVSNPVDVMSYVAWKLSGLPQNRVIGSGTNLDSSRFRVLLSQRLGVAPTSVHGFIIGEHGDSSVPIWSGVNIAGVRLRDLNPDIGGERDHENFNEVHKQVVNAAYEVIRMKGYTSWAIGLASAQLTRIILDNTSTVVAVSTSAQGKHGIEEDVFLSLPCVLNSNGITHVINQTFTDDEKKALLNSARVIFQTQKDIEV